MQLAKVWRGNRRPLLAGGAALALVAGTLTTAPMSAQADSKLSVGQIQGTGDKTPYEGKQVTTKPSVVTAVYPQSESDFRGFVIQTPGSGGHWSPTKPSQAVFVYMDSKSYDVKIGDTVSVSGTAKEFQGLTEVDGTKITQVSGKFAQPRPITDVRWEDTASHRENLESMLMKPKQSFKVSDTYPLLPYGELDLSSGQLPFQPTDVAAPDSDRNRAQRKANKTNAVGLDDGTNRGYTRTKNKPARKLPYLTRSRDVRIGDRVKINEPVIVDYRNDNWKFNPTRPMRAGHEVASIHDRKKPTAPEVGGGLSIASFNVLNYFTTTGKGRSGCTGRNLDTDGSYNVSWDCDVRGAWDTHDLKRQQDKIVSAINRLNPSVAGLMEIENSTKIGRPTDEAVKTLVGALNRAAGSHKWDYVRSSKQLEPLSDQDVISNAIIYQPGKVRLNGKAYADGKDATSDGPFKDARTPIAASFTPVQGGRPILVAVNHFKSKGSAPDSGPNADKGDGQSAWNARRVAESKALLKWLPTVQRRSKTKAVALLGDFNSYTQEDPMRNLYRGGFENAAKRADYSYSFDGRVGSLDHLLLNRTARHRMVGGAVWNSNAAESEAREYSTYKTTKLDYYRPGPYRASDHNPVMVGMDPGH